MLLLTLTQSGNSANKITRLSRLVRASGDKKYYQSILFGSVESDSTLYNKKVSFLSARSVLCKDVLFLSPNTEIVLIN